MRSLIKNPQRKIGRLRRLIRILTWAQDARDRICYAAAGCLGLGFETQFRFLPRTFMAPPIFIDVGSITHFWQTDIEIDSSLIPKVKMVKDGNWDLEKHFDVSGLYWVNPGYRTMYEMFEDGRAIHETREYQLMNDQVQDAESIINRQDLRQLTEKLSKYPLIYDDIKNAGYKSQSQLGGKSFDEIVVCIGRDGELMYYDGAHRLAIAKILKIKTIPVSVCFVHGVWAEKWFGEFGPELISSIYKGIDQIGYKVVKQASNTNV